ncbi:CU044_5270 family protein [Streptomyces sp. DH7]|uniref:CU044_5270 family protein n=1 Tax=Streptomyces sp. DH7 TaxID=2857006 RepID=UPI001E5315D1|nr:CU044_5270 family protein [Streptomyces sp. DH7]
MDELTQLRELRADAPAPDRAALAPGRALLTDAIAGRNRRARRLRADWRIASLGAAAAITAAALIVTQIVDTTAPEHGHLAARAHDPDLSGPAAALNEAAGALTRKKTPVEPRNDQWVYLREVGGTVTDRVRAGDSVRTDPSVPHPMDRSDPHTPHETWLKYGGEAEEKKRTPDLVHRPYSPRRLHRIATALPQDPRELLAELRRLFPADAGHRVAGETTDEHNYRAVFTLLDQSYAIPPHALARIYTALATVKDVKVTDRLVRDASGREVIAVTRESSRTNIRQEIFIDPRTYAYTGFREVVTKEHRAWYDGTRYPGDVIGDLARIETAVVDADRERP